MKIAVRLSGDLSREYGYTFPIISVQAIPRVGELLLIRPNQPVEGLPGLTVRARFRVVEVLHAIDPIDTHWPEITLSVVPVKN